MAYDSEKAIAYFVSFSVNPFRINLVGANAKSGAVLTNATLPSQIRSAVGIAYDPKSKSLITLICPATGSGSISKLTPDGKVSTLRTLNGVSCSAGNPASFNPSTREFVAFVDPDSPNMVFASVNVDSGAIGTKIVADCGRQINCLSRFASVSNS